MAYRSRIPADDEYLLSLGRALYNFTTLEWRVVHMIVVLSPNGFAAVPLGEPAGKISKTFQRAIDGASHVNPSVRQALQSHRDQFRTAITRRNKLLHAHPSTSSEGSQRLAAGSIAWSVDDVDCAAREFEEIALSASALYFEMLGDRERS
jgi:hypothetical protein